MTQQPGAAVVDRRRGSATVLVAAALLACGSALAGCGVVSTVKNVADNVKNVAGNLASNKSTIDAFTSSMKSGAATSFEVTYATTGAAPATIVYAVRPPGQLLFRASSTGGSTGVGSVDLIVNAAGEFSCTPSQATSASSGQWTCQKLPPTQAAVQNQLVNLYTPSHWVAFLQGLSLAAGFAGDKITRSSMTVNGFAVQCVDFQASGVPGTSKICTTAAGFLGYVQVASQTTSFEIKSYSTSPAASLFELPPGAKVIAP